jgi:uncharacterized OsmC-like protein
LTIKIYGNAKLIEGFQIMLDDNESHSTITDLAPDRGMGLGPSPLELCVQTHAGCYAVTLALTAQKMRLNLKGLKVAVEAVKSEEARTVTDENFNIEVYTDAPLDRVERMHQVTLQNCSVGILFEKAGVKTTYNLKVIGE